MASFRGALSPSFCRIIARRGARVKPQNAFFALKTIAGQWGFRASYSQTADSPPVTRVAKEPLPGNGANGLPPIPRPFSPFSARVTPAQDPFSALETIARRCSVPPSYLAWGIPPPNNPLSDGQRYLTGSGHARPARSPPRGSRQAPGSFSRPQNPINLTCPFARLLSHGGIPHPTILCPTDMTVCLASRPQRPSRASRAPWEGGPTEEGESIYTTLRACVHAYARAPASTRKRTTQK